MKELKDRILEGPKKNVRVKIIKWKGKKKSPRHIVAEVNYKTKYPRYSEWKKIPNKGKSYIDRGDYEFTFKPRRPLKNR